MGKKVTLTLADLYPVTRRQEYKVTGIVNSIEWKIDQLIFCHEVSFLIDHRPDLTVKIERKK